MEAAAGVTGSILALGVELGAVRACLLEDVGGAYRVAAWHALPRRKEASLAATSLDLCRQMGDRLDRNLIDDADAALRVTSDDVVRVPPLQHIAIAASPRPHVRVWPRGIVAHGQRKRKCQQARQSAQQGHHQRPQAQHGHHVRPALKHA